MKSFKQQIDQYLKGELSLEDTKAFEDEMKNNSELAKEVEYNRIANEIIVEDGLSAVKAKLKKIHEPAVSSTKLLMFSIASLMFIGLGVGTFLYYDDSETNTFSTQPQAYNLQDNQILDNSEKPIEDAPFEKENNQSENEGNLIENSSVPAKNAGNKEPIISTAKPDTTIAAENSKNAAINNVEETTGSDTVTVKKDVCDEVAIYANVLIENTCKDVKNGSVLIETNTVSGGEGPYQYAILPSTKRVRISEVPFSEQVYYDSLSSGYYNFLIKDKNGCLSYSERAALIRASDCTVNPEPINIDSNEDKGWLINDSLKVRASLIIKDSATNHIIFKEDFKIGNQLRWSGKDSSGNYLKKGAYNYKVEYFNGTTKSGVLKIQ